MIDHVKALKLIEEHKSITERKLAVEAEIAECLGMSVAGVTVLANLAGKAKPSDVVKHPKPSKGTKSSKQSPKAEAPTGTILSFAEWCERNGYGKMTTADPAYQKIYQRYNTWKANQFQERSKTEQNPIDAPQQ